MNPSSWYSKLIYTGLIIFRYGPWAILFGMGVYLGGQNPHIREHLSWTVVQHGFWMAGLVAALAFALLAILTVIVFAFNADWHTRDGIAALWRWLIYEAVLVGILTSLGWLVASAWPLG